MSIKKVTCHAIVSISKGLYIWKFTILFPTFFNLFKHRRLTPVTSERKHYTGVCSTLFMVTLLYLVTLPNMDCKVRLWWDFCKQIDPRTHRLAGFHSCCVASVFDAPLSRNISFGWCSNITLIPIRVCATLHNTFGKIFWSSKYDLCLHRDYFWHGNFIVFYLT